MGNQKKTRSNALRIKTMKHTTFTTKSIQILGYTQPAIWGVPIYQNFPRLFKKKPTLPLKVFNIDVFKTSFLSVID